jgi:hypothetical protein
LSSTKSLRILVVEEARLEWEDARPGTRAVIVMPLDAEEAQF